MLNQQAYCLLFSKYYYEGSKANVTSPIRTYKNRMSGINLFLQKKTIFTHNSSQHINKLSNINYLSNYISKSIYLSLHLYIFIYIYIHI